MASAPTVGVGIVRALLAYAAERGASAPALAARIGKSVEALPDDDGRVPFARYVSLMRAAKELCRNPALPLHFAHDVDLAEFSVVGLLANASGTMLEALQQLNRYGRLVTEVEVEQGDRFVLEQGDGGHWMIDARARPNDFPELTETTFTRMICHPRRFLQFPHVLAAEVTHPTPSYRAEYDRLWRVPIAFGAKRNALRLEPSIYCQRVQLHPRYVFGVLTAHARSLLAKMEDAATSRARVEELIMPVLHTGQASADIIAGRMGISRQTLYRALKAEGVTFGQVLEQLRRRLAISYLEGGKVSVQETAYLVGFSDPAAFSRAFKRWTGMAPREARNLGIGGDERPTDHPA